MKNILSFEGKRFQVEINEDDLFNTAIKLPDNRVVFVKMWFHTYPLRANSAEVVDPRTLRKGIKIVEAEELP